MSQTPSRPRLQASHLAGAAFAAWFGHLVDWAKATALPLGILFLVYYGVWLVLISETPETIDRQNQGGSLRDTASMVVQVIVFTLFAVSWHRRILLGEKPRLLPSIGGHHVRYLLRVLIVALVLFLGSMTIFAIAAGTVARGGMSFQAGVMAILGLSLLLYALARVSPLFAAQALGEPMGIGVAWRMTSGQGWSLFFGFLLVLIPVFFITAFLFGVVAGDIQMAHMEPGQMPTEEELREIWLGSYWITSIVWAIISFSTATLTVGVASAAYRELR